MKTKILIVDDLAENILALSELIQGEDVEIITANSPDSALSLVLDHDFGLALLDVQMPTMSGFELARLIRGIERGRSLPIIFVTAQTSASELIFEGYDSGAVDLLFKPLDPHIVRNKVNVFVRLDRQSRQLAQQVEMMAKLKAEAEMANIAKSRFLANMSHEIRTPLGAVLGFADVLSQSDLSQQDRQECLSSISRNGQLLLRIIDDILDLSRIEAQKVELDKSDFDVTELLRDLEMTLSAKAIDRGIELKFTTEEDCYRETGSRFTGDVLRLKQILLNVTGNALKFTSKGSVQVTTSTSLVRSLKGGEEANELRFVVRDSGVGLSPEEARRIFEPFAQADTSTRRKFGGTGLGLAISRQLARAMGGDLKLVTSEPGRGSVFEITVKVPKAKTEMKTDAGSMRAQRSDELMDLRGKKILVVDDVVDNRRLIERYLTPCGIKVGLVSGGAEALEKAEQEDWDAVLMDIQMPQMDGYEATAQLRRLGFKNPIVALTAHAMSDELNRCIKAGCDLTLTKPVAKKVLVRTLAEVLQKSSVMNGTGRSHTSTPSSFPDARSAKSQSSFDDRGDSHSAGRANRNEPPTTAAKF